MNSSQFGAVPGGQPASFGAVLQNCTDDPLIVETHPGKPSRNRVLPGPGDGARLKSVNLWNKR
jgi:hypothetical protein